jgi:LmbE family N-acetylglucosaminyl deacetylase
MRSVADILAGFAALPAAKIQDILQGQRALILAPHPDDESLGCGGFIAAACAASLPPIVAVLTDGAASHPGSQHFPPPRLAALREAEVREAVAHLGLPPDNLLLLRHADTNLPASGLAFEAACIKLALIAVETGCKLLLAPWHGDPHCDHEAAAAMADDIAARARLRLLSYPVWGWLRDGAEMVTETRRGGWRLDISAQLAAKQRAIAAHVSQYGGLITDSPSGFQLPADLLEVFARPFEVFIA